MKDSNEIIERAHAHLAKREDLRWEHAQRREHNAMYPPNWEAPAVPEVKTTDDALIEQSVDDDVLARLMTIVGEEVGIMHRELEERLERIEKHLGISNIVYKVTNNE